MTRTPISSRPDAQIYASDEQIRTRFGSSNVDKWLDVDNLSLTNSIDITNYKGDFDQAQAYDQFDVVSFDVGNGDGKRLYQANDVIETGTAFAIGIGGMTWSDSTEFTRRIQQVRVFVSEEIDGYLRSKGYYGAELLPFNPVPLIIQDIAISLCGERLFAVRGVETENKTVMFFYKKAVVQLHELVTGKLKLDLEHAQESPVTTETELTDVS